MPVPAWASLLASLHAGAGTWELFRGPGTDALGCCADTNDLFFLHGAYIFEDVGELPCWAAPWHAWSALLSTIGDTSWRCASAPVHIW